MKIIAWMFDIDGVITNPETKKVERPEIIDFIIGRLSLDEPVALITGRALPWVMQNVIPVVMQSTIDNPALLDNFFVSAEFGGATATWKNGLKKTAVNNTLRLPRALVAEIKLAGENFPKHFMEPDRESMVTFQKIDEIPTDEFKKVQSELANLFHAIVDSHGLYSSYSNLQLFRRKLSSEESIPDYINM